MPCVILSSTARPSPGGTPGFLQPTGRYIEDLGSQNGTAVNGTPIHMANILRSGDEIAMGDVRFRLKF